MAEVEPIAMEQILLGARYVESGGEVEKRDPRREENTEKKVFVVCDVYHNSACSVK